MVGLGYRHLQFGALPIAYNEIIHLPSVRIEEEMICDDISYRIMPAAELDSAEFSPVELKTLD